ncbi:spore coat protein GerQ [Risungbinella massiliensis]|uniref:spore coat protein GerQ n=1 Tax=Risungbinella massiliensis TaxID=1329796 RepID=UPI0006992BD8|nr:spore coat protein GerQ [Risungbinella massiliensis]
MYWYYPAQPQAQIRETQQQRPERMFSEDLLQRNLGRDITVYQTYENNNKWNAIVTRGRLKEVGRDFILITDKENGKDRLLFNIHVDYVVFD